jgi:hypothetical protein
MPKDEYVTKIDPALTKPRPVHEGRIAISSPKPEKEPEAS